MIGDRLRSAADLKNATGRGPAPRRRPWKGHPLLTRGRVFGLLAAGLALLPGMARAGSLGDVFERVAPSVVVVRTTDRDIPKQGSAEA